MNRKRTWRVSLRAIVVVFTACPLLVGYLSNEVHNQKVTIRCICESGGTIEYSSSTFFGPLPPPIGSVCGMHPLQLWEPAGVYGWLPKGFDRDWVDSVSSVRLCSNSLPKGLLEQVSTIRSLQYLNLAYAHCDVNELRLLTDVTRLKYLHLDGLPVDDVQLDISDHNRDVGGAEPVLHTGDRCRADTTESAPQSERCFISTVRTLRIAAWRYCRAAPLSSNWIWPKRPSTTWVCSIWSGYGFCVQSTCMILL